MRTLRTTALIALSIAFFPSCGPGEGESAFQAAVAAIRESRFPDAEKAIEGLADESDLAATAEFLRGNLAFARAEMAGRQAATAGAEPFAWDIAIRYADHALLAWTNAAVSRDDWPAARRNAERAVSLRDELRRRKAEATGAPPPPPKPQPNPKPTPPDPDPDPQKTEEEAAATAARAELSAEEVLRLVEKLREKEEEKRAVRRKERATRSATVERDW